MELGSAETGLRYSELFLSMAHWQLGDQDEARRWYDKAMEWMTEHKSEDKQLIRFRAEAEALMGLRSE